MAGKTGRWFGLPKRVALGFAVAVASLIASGVLSGVTLGKRTDASVAAEMAADTQLAVEELESAMLVSDAALDAYVAGGDARHRARYENARGRIPGAVQHLTDAVGAERVDDDGVYLGKIRPAVKRLVDGQGRALALADAGRFEEARMQRATEAVPPLERAHAALEALERREEAEVARAMASARRTRTISNAVFVGLDGLLLAFVLGAARVVRQEIRAREAHEAERARVLEVQQRIVAVVSHDLRNPLSGILTAAWALARTDLPEDAKRAARRIAAAGRRMERLIRDLLDWSRAKAGAEIPVHLCEADLYDVCTRVAEDLADARGHRIELLRAGDTRARFDPDRMEQVVANLLSNALKYGDPDRPVRVGAVGEDGAVRLEVRDEGPGLDPAIRASIFEPFQRAPRGLPGAHSSVGLGLFVVRTLTEAQGAQVDVESAPGQGTTFVVRVPRAVRLSLAEARVG
ncbi:MULTISPECIES: sensor histidine kinase KdpD [unclassified Anaeromyxobacter]|uniref:sensor histidine kinase n=1 Tax=unclassified Anaeromyxobacter TaxID=2620896 RepID=UPI001F573543|nr:MULTISPECIES: HAMP domain-containing sensor histidine kinase [unclassified Anaeromyxobacter]